MMPNPCFCTGPDHTGKCRCQRKDEYSPPPEWLQKDRSYWYNQGYYDALMDQANRKMMMQDNNSGNQTLEYSYKTVIDFLRSSLCVTDFEVMECDDGVMVVEIFLWGRSDD